MTQIREGLMAEVEGKHGERYKIVERHLGAGEGIKLVKLTDEEYEKMVKEGR